MKQLLCLLFIIQLTYVNAQQPAIGAMTVLPSVLLPTSQVIIATKVTTPAEGVLVDKTFSVTQNPNRIELRLCYGTGLLPATQTYVDTFSIGQLPAGTYSIHLRAYMSSANQHCAKIDSNEVYSAKTVLASTALSKPKSNSQQFYYDTETQHIVYSDLPKACTVSIFQMNGLLLEHYQVNGTGRLALTHLKQGLYFVRLLENNALYTIRLLKL